VSRSTNPLIRVTIFSVVLVLGLYCGLASARDDVCVYDQKDWKGDRFCTEDSIRNLADEDWNDEDWGDEDSDDEDWDDEDSDEDYDDEDEE